jgi:5-formyltetrahydrofolate cyclo-ligase
MSDPPSHRLKQAKRALRREVLALRDAIPPREREALSAAIVELLLSLPEVAAAAAIMAFWSFGSEVETAPLIERLHADGRTVALPRVEGADVVSVAHRPGDEVRPTSFGGREPTGGRELDVGELDLVVVPGVAFDHLGGRVGYGGGYYDRLLPRLRPGVPSIGVAFSVQLVPEVPTGRMDRRIDAVVTELEVIRCR